VRFACAAALAGCLAVASCGGKGERSATATNGSPRAAPDKAGVRNTIFGVYDAFTRAQGTRLCEYMAPPLRNRLLTIIFAADASLRHKPCGEAVLAFYGQVAPKDSPQAMDEAGEVGGDYSFDAIVVRRGRATATFSDAGTWDFEKRGNRWLIARFPFLPKTIGGRPVELSPKPARSQ
jgi:hypothetical protein